MQNATASAASSLAARHAFYGVLIISGAATVIMNAMFSCMFIEFRKTLLVHNSNRILFSMTLADSLVGISSILLGVLLFTSRKSKTIYTLFGVIPLFGSMFTSIFSLGILTIDRWIAVKFPLRYKYIMHVSRVKKLIILTWVIPILISVQESLVLIFVSRKFELQLRGLLLSAFFTVGSLLLFVSNTSLFLVVKKHLDFLKNNSSYVNHDETMTGQVTTEIFIKQQSRNESSSPEQETLRNKVSFKRGFSNEIKAAKTCIIITLAFIVCWAPLTAYRLSYSVGNKVRIAWLRRTFLVLASFNSLLNPLVYLMTRANFRSYMWRTAIVRGLRAMLA